MTGHSSNPNTENRLDLLMRGLECGVIILSADRRVADVNPAAEILLGSGRGLLLGVLWKDLVKRHELDAESRYRVRSVSAPSGGEEQVLLIEDLKGNGVRGAIQSDFVASVSHELRTPMAIIREGISQLREGLLGSVNEDQKKFLDMSLNSAERLDKILRALLDVSIIQSGRLSLKKGFVSLPNVVREACVFFQQAVSQKGLSLNWELAAAAPIPLYSDREQILKAIAHLIDNAVKYTPQGDITCGVEVRGSTARVWVADRGVGLTDDERIKIFEKFSQFGRIAGSGAKGLGLGLAVVKGIAEAHGGSVSAEARPGGGSIFSIHLPHAGESASYQCALKEAAARAMAESMPVTSARMSLETAGDQAAYAELVRNEFRQALKSSDHHVAVVEGHLAFILYGVDRPRSAAILGEVLTVLKSKSIVVAEDRLRFCTLPVEAASAEEMIKFLGFKFLKGGVGG